MSLGVKVRPFPLTLHVGLTRVQHYRAAWDNATTSGGQKMVSFIHHVELMLIIQRSAELVELLQHIAALAQRSDN